MTIQPVNQANFETLIQRITELKKQCVALLEALESVFESVTPYREDGSVIIPDRVMKKAVAAINAAREQTK